MTFSASLDALLATADKPALARELGELTHRLIELESDQCYVKNYYKIAAVKGRIETIRGLLGRGNEA
jgi:hypothetical protein